MQTPDDEMWLLQNEQQAHDEMYHRDITALDLHRRLNHMALHFAKYTGKIAENSRFRRFDLNSVMTDAIIIGLSTANVLGAELSEYFPEECAAKTAREIGARRAYTLRLGDTSLGTLAAIYSGQIANACEKIDHLENISFRAEITDAAAKFTLLGLAHLSRFDIDPAVAVRSRWAQVEKKAHVIMRHEVA